MTTPKHEPTPVVRQIQAPPVPMDDVLKVAALMLSTIDVDELRLKRAVDGSYIVEAMPTDAPRRMLPNNFASLGEILIGIVEGDIAKDVRGQGRNIYAILEKEGRE